MTTEGHSDSVNSVVISDDSTIIVTGSSDSLIKLWEVSTGYCRKVFQEEDDVRSVTLSNDLKTIVALSKDDSYTYSYSGLYYGLNARIWDVESSQCIRTLNGYSESVWTIAFNKDFTKIVSGSENGVLRMSDVEGSSQLIGNQYKDIKITGLKKSHYKKICMFYSKCIENEINVSDLKLIIRPKKFIGEGKKIKSVALSSDFKLILFGYTDKSVGLQIYKFGKFLWNKKRHKGAVNSVAFNVKSTLAVSGSEDKSIRVWNVKSGECIIVLNGHTDGILSVVFSSDYSMIISGSSDYTFKIWYINNLYDIKE